MLETMSAPELKIFDARPKLNAMANQLKGKGYERVGHYGGVRETERQRQRDRDREGKGKGYERVGHYSGVGDRDRETERVT